MRRTKDETDLTKKKFFNDAIDIINEKTPFKIAQFYIEGGDYFIQLEDDAEPRKCGFAFYLSKEEKLKSGGILVYNVVYDEFIAQDSTAYLGTLEVPKEYTKMLELYATLDRKKDTPYRNEVRCFFLGNTATIYNPLFTELGMTEYIEDDSRIIAPKGKPWLVRQLNIDDVKALEDYKSSFLYQLSTEEQKKYNFDNIGRDDKITFVMKKPEGAKPLFSLALDKKKYGVYAKDNCTYISSRFSSEKSTYSLDIQSHDGKIDKKYIKTYGREPYVSYLMERFYDGNLYFDNPNIKHAFYKYFRFLPR